MRHSALLTPLAILSLASPALSWGAAGHEIVATLSEIHLHPLILTYLRSSSSGLLPPWSKGHLAPLASWADRIKGLPEYIGWSNGLHYTGWKGDRPPEVCTWPKRMESEAEDGEGGWNSEHDVLRAVGNYSQRLQDNPHDWPSFNFLLHFLGDIHQPLHLTSRERGGNGDPVLWEGRKSNMHSVWDGLLIARALREQRNYTRPLPSKQIEDALTGRIYDPYIRLLLWEGVRSWWRTSLASWFACSPSTLSSPLYPASSADLPQIRLSTSPEVGPKDVVCPFTWATETHSTTCEMGFPRGYEMERKPLEEIGGRSEFYTKIRSAFSSLFSISFGQSLTLERLLTQAGLRLAAVLNTLLRPYAEEWALDNAPELLYDHLTSVEGGGVEALVNMRWMEEGW
ncbi:S1/P1 nuclease [Rhodotorula toruloides]|uniref:S1/P1 nuclease n=1 Tax=Rhodotorula toruloides TaxID=5286 RepID=A0A511KKI1_RHOTO|nr:S1/P1 nuclease [Rhodotorula toruloides]